MFCENGTFWGSKILKGKWAPKYEITKLHGLIYKCKYSNHNVKSIKDVISQAHTVEFHSKLILILRISALLKDNSQYLTELQLLSCSQIGNMYHEDPRMSLWSRESLCCHGCEVEFLGCGQWLCNWQCSFWIC